MSILTGARNFNLVLIDGGMGDMVAMLVPVDYLIRNVPRMKFHIWVPDYLIEFAKHLLPTGSLVRPFSQAETLFNNDYPGLSTKWETAHTPLRTHPVDYGFHMLANTHLYDLANKNYLQVKLVTPPKKFNLPEKYVCIGMMSPEPVKTLPAATVKELIGWLGSRGYMPVLLGSDGGAEGNEHWDAISLINRTSLLEAAQVIAGAAAFVGMDGGLVHIAGCTDTEIVAGYTLVHPSHIAPIRKGSQSYKFHPVLPDEKVSNRFFQTIHLLYPDDYRTFPGWERVVASMTADKFIRELEQILS